KRPVAHERIRLMGLRRLEESPGARRAFEKSAETELLRSGETVCGRGVLPEKADERRSEKRQHRARAIAVSGEVRDLEQLARIGRSERSPCVRRDGVLIGSDGPSRAGERRELRSVQLSEAVEGL